LTILRIHVWDYIEYFQQSFSTVDPFERRTIKNDGIFVMFSNNSEHDDLQEVPLDGSFYSITKKIINFSYSRKVKEIMVPKDIKYKKMLLINTKGR
jgi:NADH dehydrogenase FAD-containing subunit